MPVRILDKVWMIVTERGILYTAPATSKQGAWQEAERSDFRLTKKDMRARGWEAKKVSIIIEE